MLYKLIESNTNATNSILAKAIFDAFLVSKALGVNTLILAIISNPTVVQTKY